MIGLRNFLLMTFLVSLVFRNLSIGPVSVTQFVLLGSYTVALVSFLNPRTRFSFNQFLISLMWIAVAAAFWFADILSSLAHDGGDVSRGVIKSRIGAFMAFTLPFLLYSSSTSIARCNRALVGAAVIAALTIAATAFGYYDFSALGGRINTNEFANFAGEALPRTSGVLNDFGDIALLYAFAVPWIVLVPRKILAQLIILPIVGLLMLGAFLPLSRNLWLVVGVTQLLSLLFYVRLNSRRHLFKALFITITAVGAGVVFLLYSRALFSLLLSMREASSGARFLQLQGFLETFPKHVWFGVGAERCVFYGHPIHNAILLSACRTGLLGSIPFTLMYVLNFVVLCRAALRAHRLPSVEDRAATMAVFTSFVGFSAATMLFPGGAGNASQIFWGILGLFSRISVENLIYHRATSPARSRPVLRGASGARAPIGGYS